MGAAFRLVVRAGFAREVDLGLAMVGRSMPRVARAREEILREKS
jgi:hypothetical protein